ncbi:MAG: MBL fold metallo-hydrolase [Nitrososphaeria archaeon]|nr:MBL fold metallo-hydrolase [Nitrososphaeria archaeon]
MRRGGLQISSRETSLWLDYSPKRGGISLITHAHLDHVPNDLSGVITTPETASILKLFRSGEVNRTIRYGEKIKIGELAVTAYPSGHVFGSSQYLIEYDGELLVYTGDLNTYDSIFLKGAEAINSDILIMEATYGSPRYIFPKREEIYVEIIRWILQTIEKGEIPAFRVYALGKAQEIIGIVNSYLNIPAVASWTVSRINEKYRGHGLKLDYLPVDSREGIEVLKGGECVYIASRRQNPPSRRRLRWAIATGWALHYGASGYDAAFPLSGHADFPGLLDYVRASGAKNVYVVHGFSKEFTRHLRRLGINAISLD